MYQFQVENYNEKPILYQLKLIENNPNQVNMQYRLQKNGIDIAGNAKQYVSVAECKKQNLYLKAMTRDIYTLYWEWVDSPKDNQSTSSTIRGEYSLKIQGEI